MIKKLFLSLSVLLFAGLASAQDVDFHYAVGGGSLFAEEDETIDTSNLFGAVQAEVMGFDFLNIDTGVAVEAGYDSTLTYSVWNMNRAPIAGPLYAGTDLKIMKRDALGATSSDFDVRVVAGYKVDKNIRLEIYTLEDERPISFALLYRF